MRENKHTAFKTDQTTFYQPPERPTKPLGTKNINLRRYTHPGSSLSLRAERRETNTRAKLQPATMLFYSIPKFWQIPILPETNQHQHKQKPKPTQTPTNKQNNNHKQPKSI